VSLPKEDIVGLEIIEEGPAPALCLSRKDHDASTYVRVSLKMVVEKGDLNRYCGDKVPKAWSSISHMLAELIIQNILPRCIHLVVLYLCSKHPRLNEG